MPFRIEGRCSSIWSAHEERLRVVDNVRGLREDAEILIPQQLLAMKRTDGRRLADLLVAQQPGGVLLDNIGDLWVNSVQSDVRLVVDESDAVVVSELETKQPFEKMDVLVDNVQFLVRGNFHPLLILQ